MRFDFVLLTCEHGGNEVPAAYRPLFRKHARLLNSHRGWDPGALYVARSWSRSLRAPLIAATVTRLLVELNRSPHHKDLFSKITRSLPNVERERILAEHYRPHREAVEAAVARQVKRGDRVLHIGVHTFTPILHGVTRNADVGLLYDPARPREREFCRAWADALRERDNPWRVRFNYPYRGNSDGLTTWLRRRFPASRYLGIEVEMNQRFFLDGRLQASARALSGDVLSALQKAVR